MAISGLVARGASESLEDLVRQKLLEEQLAQQAEQQAQQAAFRERQFGEEMRQFDVNQRRMDTDAALDRDERATGRRERANRAGVADMLAQRKLMDTQASEAALDADVATLPPSARRLVDLRRRGVNVSAEDLETPEERQTRERTDEDADVRRAGRIAAAQRGPGGSAGQEWVIRGGQVTPIPKGTARPGDQPYASARDSLRNVTAGDAARIAELQTSLDDLAVVRDTLSASSDATGSVAQVGAMLPNVVTETLGWGRAAKQRQATIDRVKQVIGKALEGGVLRKEDEAKYARILPTIGDDPAVVRTKLDGLEQAITLRIDRELEARESAGFDVSGFRSPTTTDGPAIGTIRTIDGQRARWDGKGWVAQ